MSKRYVEKDLFVDPWFRKLSPSAKLLWTFLCCHCDNSGTWERDDDYASYLTGLDEDLETLLSELGNRVVPINDEKLLLPKFILFQQGKTLHETKGPHRGIIKLLQKHNLERDEFGITKPIVKQKLTKRKAKRKQRVTKPLVTSYSNSNSNGKGGMGETPTSNDPSVPPQLDHPEFHAAWNDWIAYRKERKFSPYKPIGLSALFSKLIDWERTHGIREVAAALKTSMRNQWRGVFEPKPDPNSRIDPNQIDYSKSFDLDSQPQTKANP